jgi:hypothetical protein
MKYQTISARIIGGMCGPIWWPAGAMCGKPVSDDLAARMARFSEPATFRDALLSLLNSEGGDFQHALFTVDTVILIERGAVERAGKNGRYRTHTREIEVARIAPDLVSEAHYSYDFNGEAE